MRLLLDHGADVNAADNDGDTALMEAASGGHTAITEALIAAGADVNARDDYSAALWRAALHDHLEVIRVLIAHGAEVNARTRDGETALERARLEGHTQIVAWLKGAGAKE